MEFSSKFDLDSILDNLIPIMFWWMHSNENSFTRRNHFVIKCESCKFTLTFRNVRMAFLVQPLFHTLFSHASPPIRSINLTETFHWHTAIQTFSPLIPLAKVAFLVDGLSNARMSSAHLTYSSTVLFGRTDLFWK